MKISEILCEENVIDNDNGAGRTPNNGNVDYLGIKVMMKPSVFLKLAATMTYKNDKKLEGLKKYIIDGGKIASPFLYVQLKRKDAILSGEDAKIITHEGRNRMLAVEGTVGDAAIEVHLFFAGDLRNRDLNAPILKELRLGMFSEDGQYILGPLFEVKYG